jgi:hypothetical protein
LRWWALAPLQPRGRVHGGHGEAAIELSIFRQKCFNLAGRKVPGTLSAANDALADREILAFSCAVFLGGIAVAALSYFFAAPIFSFWIEYARSCGRRATFRFTLPTNEGAIL